MKILIKCFFLRKSKGELRGWLLDILKCVELLDKKEFSLDEIYAFETFLKTKHPETLKWIPLLLAVRAKEISVTDEMGEYNFSFNKLENSEISIP